MEGSSYSVCSSCNQAHILSTTSTSPHSTNTAIIIPSPPIQCTNTRPPPLPVHPLKMDDLFSTQARFAFFPPPCQLFLTHWHPQTSLFLRSAPWNPPPKKTIRLRRGSGCRGGVWVGYFSLSRVSRMVVLWSVESCARTKNS